MSTMVYVLMKRRRDHRTHELELESHVCGVFSTAEKPMDALVAYGYIKEPSETWGIDTPRAYFSIIDVEVDDVDAF